MRDYDPTTGRYIQADPLGLVDGASVYGYALQNPLRYVDPRGEFVWWVPLAGFVGGAAANGSIQFFTNLYYGKMSPSDAYKCIDIKPVFVAGAVAGSGMGMVSNIFRKKFAEALGGGAIGYQVNTFFDVMPPAYIDGSCGCEIPELPWWLDLMIKLPFL
ncbi:MAG: hypothetical protein HUJ27_14030 [Rhodobacteraceae bacterium]|nr:hypothetical protein [Paracoccaceae bacterium]